jgi:hypothetical protein
MPPERALQFNVPYPINSMVTRFNVKVKDLTLRLWFLRQMSSLFV